MTKLLKWILMLCKRLYKKPAFIAILLLIPLCVLFFGIASEEDSGFLHITLAQTDETDSLSAQVIDELINCDTIVRFSRSESPSAATEAVKTGQADEAWIFPADTEGKISEFITGGTDRFISIVSREQTVFTRLSHEKLSAILYEYCAKAYYLDFARTNVTELDSLSDDELIEYYESVSITEELFEFGNPVSFENAADTNYLTVPIRGLLGILATLCAMAAALFFTQDETNGTFSHVPQRNRIYIGFGCIWIAVLNVCAAIFLSLTVSGISHGILRELCSLILFSLCCTVFGLLLKLIIPNIKLYTATIPLLTVLMIVICPIFFDFQSFGIVKMIFPTTYYVNASYNSSYLLYMAIYTVVGLVLCLGIYTLKCLKFKKHR